MSPTPARKPHRQRGFSLVEVLIAVSLSVVLMGAVMTSFLMLSRSGANLANYSDMEAEGRVSLEQFAQDVRQASNIIWNSPTKVTLTFNSADNVSYELGGLANNEFIRLVHNGPTIRKKTLITGVDNTTFALTGYTVNGHKLPVSTDAERTVANRDTKQLQLQLKSLRSTVTVSTATNSVLSARFILRNKRVTS